MLKYEDCFESLRQVDGSKECTFSFKVTASKVCRIHRQL